MLLSECDAHGEIVRQLKAEVERLRVLCGRAWEALTDLGLAHDDGTHVLLEAELRAIGRSVKSAGRGEGKP
jgi:hypothetical protein